MLSRELFDVSVSSCSRHGVTYLLKILLVLQSSWELMMVVVLDGMVKTVKRPSDHLMLLVRYVVQRSGDDRCAR